MEMTSGLFVNNLWKNSFLAFILGCTAISVFAQDTLTVGQGRLAVELNYGQLHPWFRSFPAGYTLSGSSFTEFRFQYPIVVMHHWSLLLGVGSFLGCEQWWRKALTEQDILQGTESRVESRLYFYGIEAMFGIEKKIFRNRGTLRVSQGLLHMFSVRANHIYVMGYSGETRSIDDFPYSLPKLNTKSVLAAGYRLDALIEGLEVGISLQHIWRPMQLLVTNAKSTRSHILIYGRYSF
jgi:hypothetical protein